MDETGESYRVAVLQIHGGDGDGADLILNFNEQRIAVSVFPSSSNSDRIQRSIQDHLIDLMDRAASEEVDDERYEELEDEILGIILDAGRPVFEAQGMLHTKSGSPRYLHSALYPMTLHFQLLDTRDNAVIIPIEPSEAYTLSAGETGCDSAEEDELGIDTSLPWHSTKAILVLEIFAEGGEHAASRVLVDGKEMFCKAVGSVGGLFGTSVGRELECLQKVRKFPPEREAVMQIPQLLGHVRHADTGRVVGFLREWVPGRRLRDIGVPTTPAQLKHKWIGQIREAVHVLHSQGTIWGDGKPSNVVIDEQDSAWMIDFGGGWTDGWVDEELADTAEGDELAIRKIEGFLEIQSKP